TTGTFDAASPNTFTGTAHFVSTSTFTTNKHVQVAGLLDFDGDTVLTQTGDRVFEVLTGGSVQLMTRAIASLDANVALREYSAGVAGGVLRASDQSQLTVLQGDT